MSDSTATDMTSGSFGDLPMQPSGSGVADLEIAYEQMRLAGDAEAAEPLIDADAADDVSGDATTMVPPSFDDAAADSAAHPS